MIFKISLEAHQATHSPLIKHLGRNLKVIDSPAESY